MPINRNPLTFRNTAITSEWKALTGMQKQILISAYTTEMQKYSLQITALQVQNVLETARPKVLVGFDEQARPYIRIAPDCSEDIVKRLADKLL